MTSKKTIEAYPEGDARSVGYHVAQSGLGVTDLVLPGLGYALQQVVGHYVGDPLTKRRDEWFKGVGSGLAELQERFSGFDPATLSENEEFLSTVYEASHIAMKTHKEFKREALRNTVLNAAVGYTVDDSLRGRFISCIEEFSEAHIRVLRVLQSPESYPLAVQQAKGIMAGPQSTVIRAEITEKEIPSDLFSIVLADLARHGFTNGALGGMVSSQSLLVKRTTTTGDAFLRFIDAPTP